MSSFIEVIDLDDDDDDNVIEIDDHKPIEDTKLFIILNLQCLESTCSDTFEDITQLNDHLLRVHSIRSCLCLVKDCSRSFRSSRRLTKHLNKSHRNVTEWHCGRCSKYFESYDRLSKHTIEKHHLGRFQCSFSGCEFISKKRRKVNIHFKREHQVVVDEVEIDNDSVVLLTEDNQGIDEDGSTLKPQNEQPNDEQSAFIILNLQCPDSTCLETFVNKTQLDDHLLQVHSIREFPCLLKDCNRSFRSSLRLAKHIDRTHFDTTEWHCDKCSKHYKTYDRLVKHTIEKHHLGQFQCSLSGCEFISRKRSKIKRHYNREHLIEIDDDMEVEDDDEDETSRQRTNKAKQPNKDSAHCTIISLKCLASHCSLMFADKDKLDDHLEQVHSVKKNRCVMKDCGRSFVSVFALIDHLNEAHLNATEYECDVCPKQYSSYKLLASHFNRQHQLGQFGCSFPGCQHPIQTIRTNVLNHYAQLHKADHICQHPACGYRSYNPQNLKQHERGHLGKKPFRCKWPDCGYASPQRSNAMTHIRNTHCNPKKILLKKSRAVACPANPKDFLEVVQDLL